MDGTKGRITTHRIICQIGDIWICCRTKDISEARLVGGWLKSQKIALDGREGGEISFRLTTPVTDAFNIITDTINGMPWLAGSYDPRALIGGMDRITYQREKRMKEDKSTASDALSDLEALRKNAQAMVALSKRVAAADTGEENEMQKLLNEYGLRDAQDLRSTSLEQELKNVTLRLLNRSRAKMMLVEDLYCVFNRLRGTNLVSPRDFMSSLRQVGQGPDLRLRPIHNALCVQLKAANEEEVAEELAKLCTEHPHTAAMVAKTMEISIRLAQVQLLDAELLGHLCRDDSIEGLRFYDNRFLSQEWGV